MLMQSQKQNEALLSLWKMCEEARSSLPLDWYMCWLKQSSKICYDDIFSNNSINLYLLDCNHFLTQCFTTLDSYQYKEKDGTYGQEYGVFSIFCMFMALYTIFVGCLFFFHLFLILSNLTTRELISRGKAKYLKGIKGNPFSEGLFENVKMAMDIPSEGQ